jgi:hypothetical protein
MITTDQTDLDDARGYIRNLELGLDELQGRIDRALEVFDNSPVFMPKRLARQMKDALMGGDR